MELSSHQWVGLITLAMFIVFGGLVYCATLLEPQEEETDEQARERASGLDKIIGAIDPERL
jgi:hypothetical protein